MAYRKWTEIGNQISILWNDFEDRRRIYWNNVSIDIYLSAIIRLPNQFETNENQSSTQATNKKGNPDKRVQNETKTQHVPPSSHPRTKTKKSLQTEKRFFSIYERSPRRRRASCISLGWMVTRFPWIAHKLVSITVLAICQSSRTYLRTRKQGKLQQLLAKHR